MEHGEMNGTKAWVTMSGWAGIVIAFFGGAFILLVGQELAHLVFFGSTILAVDSPKTLTVDLLLPVFLFFVICGVAGALMLAHFRRTTIWKVLVGLGCVWFGIGFLLGSKDAGKPFQSVRSLSDEDLQPRVTSRVVGEAMPHIDLPPLSGINRDGKQIPGLNDGAFKGRVTLVNVWGSWCVPCRDEVSYLDVLSKDDRIQLVGINYKDSAENARRFLDRYGNPFAAIGRDENGRVAMDGIKDVPETYLVGRDSRIVYKIAGPINAETLKNALVPQIERELAKQ